MNKKQLIDKLLKNWPAKVICLTIAIFLYLFYQASLIEKKSFVIPLELEESGLVVHVGNIPSSVVINVRADENEIKAIFASDFKASVNLNNIIESGSYSLPIEVKISDKLMAIDPLEVELKEENLKINVEKRISRFVDVVPSVVGEVAEDYELKSVTMEPANVEIRGPESLVNAVNEIKTDRVNVSNAKTNFSVDTTYLEVSKFVEIINKDVCKATVVVEPKIVERSYENISVKILNLADNLELVDPVPAYSMTVSGYLPDIKKYSDRKNNIRIDLSGITEPGVYDVPVKYGVPLDLKIIETTGDTVKVNLKLKELPPEENPADEHGEEEIKD